MIINLQPKSFLIVNPEFTSANNILSVGQQVKVGLINPIVDVVVETHNVIDQESKFENSRTRRSRHDVWNRRGCSRRTKRC